MPKKDLYQILGVSRNASPEAIKSAYRKIALRYHPDKNPGMKWAEEKFKEASAAYRTLNDPEQKRRYDQSLGMSPQDQGFNGFKKAEGESSRFSDLFEDLFKAGPQTRRRAKAKPHPTSAGERGSDIRIDLAVSFAEAMLGTRKTINVQRNEACERCAGTGAQEGSRQSTCPKCMGSGDLPQRSMFNGGWSNRSCSRCHGTGVLIHQPCRTCRGSGVVSKERSLLVKVPPGIEDGKSLRLPGQGEAGLRGGRSGDLFVDMTVEPHPYLQRDGYDLRCQLSISFAKAVLGGEIQVPTLTSSATLYIPRGTPCNQVFRLKGHGLKKFENGYGDLLITVIIDVPKNLTRKQEKLLNEYARLEDKPFWRW